LKKQYPNINSIEDIKKWLISKIKIF
jgi:hypothetical protein